MCVSHEALPQNKAFAIRPFQLMLYGTICNVCVCMYMCVCENVCNMCCNICHFDKFVTFLYK